MAEAAPSIVELRGVRKSFGGVHALRGVDLELRRGEVLALLGQNGAGKSTLIGVLSGRVAPDAGEIIIDGESRAAMSVPEARAAGIAVVYQELSLFDHFSVAENLYFNDPDYYSRGFFRAARGREDGEALLARLFPRSKLPIDAPVRELSIAQCQLVEIARALHRQARVIVLDEPTASLSAREVEELLDVVGELRAHGTTFLFVTHKLQEARRLADRVTVLRDGRIVSSGEMDTGVAAAGSLEKAITGLREITSGTPTPRPPAVEREPRLRVEGLRPRSWRSALDLEIGRGETLAVLGLTGSGRSSLARAIFGIDMPEEGSVRVDGRAIPPGNLSRSIAAGIAFVPDDRRRQGLVLGMSLRDNLDLPHQARRGAAGWVGRRGQDRRIDEIIERLDIQPPRPEAAAVSLSGGNQQKAAVGRWFSLQDLRVVILDEPTKGVDVGARAELYEVIRQLNRDGIAVLLVPSEPSEALQVAHRMLVVRDHEVIAETTGGRSDERELSRLMAGPRAGAAA